MNVFDDIKIYLPKYLSDASQKALFSELKFFPENIDKRFYSTILSTNNFLHQGDGCNGIVFSDFEEREFYKAKGFIVNNTCDIQTSNNRLFQSYVTFAPIFSLKKYEDTLRKQFKDKSTQISGHIDSIRKQEITQIFYLPEHSDLGENFVRLDSLQSMPIEMNKDSEWERNRILCLSNYGFYVFLIKISVHFSRVRENLDRG